MMRLFLVEKEGGAPYRPRAVQVQRRAQLHQRREAKASLPQSPADQRIHFRGNLRTWSASQRDSAGSAAVIVNRGVRID